MGAVRLPYQRAEISNCSVKVLLFVACQPGSMAAAEPATLYGGGYTGYPQAWIVPGPWLQSYEGVLFIICRVFQGSHCDRTSWQLWSDRMRRTKLGSAACSCNLRTIDGCSCCRSRHFGRWGTLLRRAPFQLQLPLGASCQAGKVRRSRPLMQAQFKRAKDA